MSLRRVALALVVLSVSLVTLRGERRAEKWTRVTPMTSPAAAGSGEPGLASDGKGRVWLSWLEPADGGVTRFRVAPLGGAASPTTIAEGKNLFVNWADVPAVFRGNDGTFTAHWLERNGPSREAYDIKLATSRDGLKWTPAGTPHRDGTQAEHGFVSFFNHPRGGTGLIWLDGRNMAGGHGDHMAGGTAATMLRSTQITTAKGASTSVTGEDAAIDPRVCDCCSTSAASTSNGVIVAYRDRSDKEVRDISVSRFDGKSWSAPASVHADNWEINACPVNGPVVAAHGTSVAVAWFTQAGGTPHSNLAFSTDGGRTFGAPIKLDTGTSFGRLGMVMPDARTVLVSSIERSGGDTSLLVRQVTAEGRVQAPVLIAGVSSERASGFPRLVIDGDRVIVAWTTVTSGRASGVQVASLR